MDTPSVVTPKMLQLTEDDLDFIEVALHVAIQQFEAISSLSRVQHFNPSHDSGQQWRATQDSERCRALLLKIQANR